jgi:small subunit ribosomal protein S15
MHGRAHGKSESKRPIRSKAPEWIKTKPEEISDKVVELARKGVSQSMIGMSLRDQYGIPLVKQATGKKVYQILKEHQVAPALPQDLLDLVRRAVDLRRHMENNKKDLHAKYGLVRIESKIHRLSKYYIREGTLPKDWKYVPEKMVLIVR